MGWILATLLAGGALLLFGGLRGRRTGDAPHCAACGFDLTSVPGRVYGHRPRAICPECGVHIASPEQICIGRRVRRRWAIATGSLALAAFILMTAAMQVPAVRRLRWIEHKPESWLLRDAIEAYESALDHLPPQPWGTPSWYRDANLPELYRRATDGTLSDATLAQAARTATRFMRAWSPTNGVHGPWPHSGSSSGIDWADLGGLALDRQLLTREEQVAFATATMTVAVLTPPRVVRGDPLPIEFALAGWAPEWESRHGGLWPTDWGRAPVIFTLRSATVDGKPINLFQFGPDGEAIKTRSGRTLDARARGVPPDRHPRADDQPGTHTLRVELTARLNTALPRVLDGVGRFATPANLGFPDQGWPIVVETTFEVVASGPTRDKVPMDEPLGYFARLDVFGGAPGDLIIRRSLSRMGDSRPGWMRAGHVLAARLTLGIQNASFDLGPIVLPIRDSFAEWVELPPDAAQAVLAAPPGSVRLVFTFDPEVATLLIRPGPLLDFDPIEIPVEIREHTPTDGSATP